ncbi:MAG TPA: cell division/cell wall cluster transcriptional repressor MraZ, partial [Candidatus Paceibacterota bacterium]|nr:cell division/cell wall cluster transcriptional repressor MraZ [Candidatus Paceibacterota bacterium]
DNCLFIYSKASWEKVARRLESLSFAQADTRGFNRFILSGAAEVEVDSAGRILIPDHQKEFAGLKKQVVFAGVSDRVEVWDEARWSAYKAKIEKSADSLAEKLGELGAL